MSRSFDVVLFGATGYTANLVLDYVLKEVPAAERFTLAIAGRSRDKLERVLKKYASVVDGIIIADTLDQNSMESMTKSCYCLLNTVGPYVKYGESAVKACLSTKTDYVDINGETGFIHEMQQKYDAEAREKGISICMACGFDSLASDIMFYFTMKNLMEMFADISGKRLTLQTIVHMGQKKNFWAPPFSLVDGVSNGTFATALHGWKTGEGINVFQNPLGYQSVTKDKLLTPTVGWITDVNRGNGLAAFPCEIFSDAFIARTTYVNTVLNAKSKEMKPVSFEYGQYFGTTSLFLAYILVGFLHIGPFLIKVPGMYYLLSKLMGSGDGPSEASRQNLKTNVYSLMKVYENDSSSNENPVTKIVTEMELKCDNYTFTAVAVYQCAKLMVNLRKRNQLPVEGGVLSPVAGLGGENIVPLLKGILTLSKL